METFENVSCSLCGSSTVIPFSAGSIHLNIVTPLSVSRCAQCGLLFMNPRPSLASRELIFAGGKPIGLEPYLQSHARYGSVTQSRLPFFRERVKMLKRLKPGSNISVLDIGASSGEFLTASIEMGWKASGIEPSTAGVEAAQSKGLNVVQSTAERLPFADEQFDIVHSNHVFEHLADPQLAANEAFRVLKPGGLIFIEVPNQFDNIQFFRDRVFNRIVVREQNIRSIHHLYFFSKRTLTKLLTNAGFKNVQIKDRYGRNRKGLAKIGSMLTRLAGSLYLGGPIIQGLGWKPGNS